MAYLIDTYYIQYPGGKLVPCQNRKTAEYMVKNTEAIAIVDVTREEMSK